MDQSKGGPRPNRTTKGDRNIVWPILKVSTIAGLTNNVESKATCCVKNRTLRLLHHTQPHLRVTWTITNMHMVRVFLGYTYEIFLSHTLRYLGCPYLVDG